MERIIQKVTPPARKKAPKLKRVAAYARVSTNSEEQLTSYEAQVDYYTRYIQSKPDEWDFVGIYTDEWDFRNQPEKARRLQPDDCRRAGRENRPDYYQVGVPLCPQHRGYSNYRPQAQRKRD